MFALTLEIDVVAWLIAIGKALGWMLLGVILFIGIFMRGFTPFR